jgi:hypothetical protein
VRDWYLALVDAITSDPGQPLADLALVPSAATAEVAGAPPRRLVPNDRAVHRRGRQTLNPHQIVYRQLNVVGSWAFTGAHLIEYVNLLPTLAERFDLARLVTAYPLAEPSRRYGPSPAAR